MNRRRFLSRCGRWAATAGATRAAWFGIPCLAFAQPSTANPATSMSTLEDAAERHFVIRRDDAMYEEFPELCLLPSGKLLCVYKVGAKHGPGDLVVLLESADRGRTWNTRHEFRVPCDMPRLQRLSDGRLWLDTDSDGNVFISEDDGGTWTEHNVGFGGHGHDRIIELPDGSWINTTCEPHGSGWHFRGRPYRIVQYRSTDRGRTWKRDAMVADVPGFHMSEATTVLLPDGRLVSYIRESSGLAHGCVRAVSTDNGRTWDVGRAPFNFAMPRAGLLQDGRMLVVGRNFAGNKSLYAWCDSPLATEGFRVQSMWAPDDSALLTPEGLRVRCTGDEPAGAATRRMTIERVDAKFGPGWEGLTTSGIEPPTYILPAPRRRDSRVTIDARLRVLSNETGLACVISITEAEEVSFFPDRVEVFGQAGTAFRLDGTKFHDYRVVRDADSLAVFVDGTQRIRTSKLARSRGVGYGVDTTHFGTSYRAFRHPFESQDHFRRRAVVGAGESVWQRVNIAVENPRGPSDTWSWDAADGTCPDQYERDRMVEVKWQPLPNGQGGPSWVQFPDGEILVVHNGCMAEDAAVPFLMGRSLKPSDFRAPLPAEAGT